MNEIVSLRIHTAKDIIIKLGEIALQENRQYNKERIQHVINLLSDAVTIAEDD